MLTHRIHCFTTGSSWRYVIALACLMSLAGVGHAQTTSSDTTTDTPDYNAPPEIQPTTSRQTIDQMIQNSATGVILPGHPIESNLILKANSTQAWLDNGTHHLLLSGDTNVAIGSYGFKAERAVILITPLNIPGLNAHRLDIYLDKVSELGGYGPISNEAPRLLITATITGKIKLDTDSLKRQSAVKDPLAIAAMNRIARYYQAIAANTKPLPSGDPLYSAETLANRNERQKAVRGSVAAPVATAQLPTDTTTNTGTDVDEEPVVVIKPKPQQDTDSKETITQHPITGQVDFSAGKIVYQGGDEESLLLLMNNIQVMYNDPENKRSLTMTADKAVIFFEPDAIKSATGTSNTTASQVRGVYLEDNVIVTDGQYTMRGPRVFYDFTTSRAIVLDAVFYTYDIKEKVPIYVRARSLKQESKDQWTAKGAKLSTSEFFEPHFAVGMKELTLTRRTQTDGTDAHYVKAKDITLQAGGVPLFYWPGMSGKATDVPLRQVKVNIDSDDGVMIKTKWDLFSILGQDKPSGLDASLILDGYTERGVGIGIEADYDVPKAYGFLDSYFLYDTGEDNPSGRKEVEPPNEYRGRINWRHRHLLPDNWEATLELGYTSDPTFLEEFFQNEAFADKPYETLLYLKKQEDDSAFTFLMSYDVNDFPTSMVSLQTVGTPGLPGYNVDKYPELAYYRIGTSLFNDKLTWYSQNSASAMSFHFADQSPSDWGFNTAQSLALFGIAPAKDFDEAFFDAGLDEDTAYRFDTRQELQAPMKIGFLDVVPYVVGRFTAYDEGFDDYSGEDDNIRYWGSVGLKLHTAFSNSYNGVDNRMFDLHRLRHIIEPSLSVSYSDTNIKQENLPVYDYDVESLAEGTTVRVGLRNTFQTQRGGEGRWQSVDWLRLDTDFVFHSDDTTRESPIPRYFDYRPELSLAGDHFWSEAVWQLSEALAVSGDMTYSFDSHDVEQWNVGFRMTHTPRMQSFVETRQIDDLDTFYVRYGVEYLLTPKYHLRFSHGYDFDHSKSRSLSFVVTRRLPRMLLIVAVDVDTVTDETTFGIAISPEGFSGKGRAERNPFLRNY